MVSLLGMSKPRILIVEDNESILELYATAFINSGIEVLKTNNGKEGVELALVHHPDAILMDIVMPGMNGHEAVEKIRLDAWGRDAKIVFLTNMSSAENVVRAVEAGSDEYIIKANTDVKEIVNKVRTVINS